MGDCLFALATAMEETTAVAEAVAAQATGVALKPDAVLNAHQEKPQQVPAHSGSRVVNSVVWAVWCGWFQTAIFLSEQKNMPPFFAGPPGCSA